MSSSSLENRQEAAKHEMRSSLVSSMHQPQPLNQTSDATRPLLVLRLSDQKLPLPFPVFLKHLEYFSGIIFLTTNRIRAFDMAMKSRIHLALSYSPPDHEARRQLWNQVLGEIPASEIDMDPDDDGEELWQEKLNGREIAYAVSTARTIARYEGQPLRLEHLHTVVGVRREFDASLEEAARKMTGLSMHRSDSILGDTKGDFKS